MVRFGFRGSVAKEAYRGQNEPEAAGEEQTWTSSTARLEADHKSEKSWLQLDYLRLCGHSRLVGSNSRGRSGYRRRAGQIAVGRGSRFRWPKTNQ